MNRFRTAIFPLQRCWRYLLLGLFALSALSACDLYRLRGLGAPLYFAGRLALTQDADPRDPQSKAQSWSAHFELAGTPDKGTLRLYTPVGTTVAQVRWEQGFAILETNEETREYTSLDALTLDYFQQSIPVAALFDWLQGKPTRREIPGWNVDLNRSASGVISAERANPVPRVRLRAIVEEHDENSAEESNSAAPLPPGEPTAAPAASITGHVLPG